MRFSHATGVPGGRSIRRVGQLTAALALLIFVHAAMHRPVGAASLLISPQAVTLAPGGVQAFDVRGERGKVSWKATGGTVSSRGVYTAGTTPGAFVVRVTNHGITAVATVTITAPPAPVQDAPVQETAVPAPEADTTVSPAPDSTNPIVAATESNVTVFSGTEVPIAPGESIQAAVNAHAEGTAFRIRAGVHRRQSFRPKSGMSFIGEPGAILDGENATPRAIIGEGTRNVTVRGLRVTRYTPPDITAAVDAIDSYGWVVENNEIDNNASGLLRSYGLRIGHQMIARGNVIHHNGYVGISGYKAVDTLIEGNDVYANPPALRDDSIGEAANMKCYACGRIIVRNNYFHDSPFRGIWFDRSQPDLLIEGNRIVNHGQPGIWYEVSYRGVIRNNYVENAGYNSYYSSGWLRGGGITVTNSPDVSVLDNVVVNSHNGIIGLQAGSYYDGPYGKSELRNLLVKGNTIVMPKGQTGLAQNIGTDAVFVSWNNRFEGNRYELLSNPRPFSWMGLSLDEHQWQAYGQDSAASAAAFGR